MEYRSYVFNASRDGKLRRLKSLLDNRSKEEVKLIVSLKSNGATPLLIASRNGHLDVCEYIIEKCNADIEQVGSVCFDGDTIEGAPPLWCAAAAGHTAIVKSLIQHGSKVNSTTKTNSTPLRAACFDGHFEIVKYLVDHGADIEIANRHGHTCLMIACYKSHYKIAKYLIENGADVNRKSVKGNTALHDCAESGSIEIMKLLLSHGAKMDIDSYGMIPLNAAALSGHTAIIELIIASPYCSKIERINALELLGATFVDKKRDMLGSLEFWKRAIIERYSDVNAPIKKVLPLPNPAYDNASEVRTIEELEELVSDPDGMRMQALLVRERVLGPAHPDTSYYIRYRGAVYADTGNFDRCIRLWTYALDMQQKIEPLSAMTQSSLLSFVELFSYMMSKSISTVRFADLFGILQRSINELHSLCKVNRTSSQFEQESDNLNRTLNIIMHFIGLLCQLKPLMSVLQEHQLKSAVYHLVQLNPKGKNGTHLIHIACSGDTSIIRHLPLFEISMLDVLNLLLEVGASPHVLDNVMNTPLHIAASSKPFGGAMFNTLLDYGAHLDTRNAFNEVPLQIASVSSIKVDIYPLKHLSLQCLCAQTIVRYNIPFREKIPFRIEQFVELH